MPPVTPTEQVSVSGFLYADDDHELDFECGYGAAAVRSQVMPHLQGGSAVPGPGDLVCHLVSQAKPHSIVHVAVMAHARFITASSAGDFTMRRQATCR